MHAPRDYSTRRQFFDPFALNPGVKPREVIAWSLYDFANSGYTTVVLTAVFNAYFVRVVAGDASWATFAWTLALSLSNFIVMLTMPGIGALADQHGSKKRWLALATFLCIAATAGLATCGRGDIAAAMVLVIISNYGFSLGEALCGAFLPELAKPTALGRVSGWGWSLGYVGGMLTLALSLGYVAWAQKQNMTAEQFVPVTNLFVAGVFVVAALPLFAIMRERASPRVDARDTSTFRLFFQALFDLRLSLARTRPLVDLRRFLWTGVAYQAGIGAVIAVAAVYADQVMGFQQTETMMLIFLLNIAAAIGAFLFGYLEDRMGHKGALALTLVGWIAMVALVVMAESKPVFWAAAVLAGLCMGSSQSCGRAMVGAMAPAARIAEVYGLWAMATRFAAILGMLTYGAISWATAGNHRLAAMSLGVFFVVGLVLLMRVNVERGASAAAAVPN